MNGKDIELTRRRVLGGLVTVGGASAAAGAGTFAFFSDTEDSTGNTIEAASLNLTIDGEDDTETTTVTATGTNGNGIVPGDSGSGSSSITNDGDIDGYIDVSITDASTNALADNLNVAVFIDDDDDTSTADNQTSVVDDKAANLDGDYDVNHLLPAGNTSNLVVEWDLPTSVTEGEGETVTFDIAVHLDQTDKNQ